MQDLEIRKEDLKKSIEHQFFLLQEIDSKIKKNESEIVNLFL